MSRLLACCVIFAALVSVGCPGTSTETIDLSGVTLEVGKSPDLVDQRFVFFVGGPTNRFDLNLQLEGASPSCPVVARMGGGTEVATLKTDGEHTLSFRGNVGILHVKSDGLVDPPLLHLQSVDLQPAAQAQFPEFESVLADHVRSMPLTLDAPVELPFASDGGTYFLSMQGVSGLELDVLLDMSAMPSGSEVFLNTDPTIGFPLTAASSDFVLSTADTGFLQISIPSHRDRLYVTVKVTPDPRFPLGRFCIKRATSEAGTLPMSVRFVTPESVSDAHVESVSASLVDAAQMLYQVTAGRVRIPAFTIHRKLELGQSKLLDDIYVSLPITGGTTFAPLPAGSFSFEMVEPPGNAIGSITLLRLILQERLGAPAEVSDAPNPCPNSFQSPSGHRALCWQGNHNPGNDSALSAKSAWEHVADTLWLQIPDAEPPQYFHFPSSVRVPVELKVQ